MPARPRASFEVIEAEFVFQFPIILFNAPPTFREPHEPTQAERFAGELGEPIVGRGVLAPRPFDQQADWGTLRGPARASPSFRRAASVGPRASR